MAPNKGLLIVSTLLCIPLFVYIFVFSGQWLQGGSNGPKDFDIVLFSQNLPLAACAKLHLESPSKKCLLPADGGWKIRGLAPFFLNKAGPGSCKKSLTINMTKLATIKNQLSMKWPDLYNQTTTWDQRGTNFIKKPTTTMPSTIQTNNLPTTTMMMEMDPANDLSTTPSNDPINLPTTTIKIVAESSRVRRDIPTPATILLSETEAPSETESPPPSTFSREMFDNKTSMTDKNSTQQTTTTTTTARPSVISKIAPKSITADNFTSGGVLTSAVIKTTPAPVEMVDENYFNYWENEWEKHGACGFDSQDQILGYFEKGFSLMEQYDMSEIMKKADIQPGGEYSVIKIQQGIEKVVGARCRVKCFWDEETRTSYLLEVSICFDKSVKNAVDCDAVGGSLTNCYVDKNVEYIDRKKFNCIINDNCEKKKLQKIKFL